jgi:hypothetical protein
MVLPTLRNDSLDSFLLSIVCLTDLWTIWSPFASQPKYEALRREADIELDSTESLPLESRK